MHTGRTAVLEEGTEPLGERSRYPARWRVGPLLRRVWVFGCLLRGEGLDQGSTVRPLRDGRRRNDTVAGIGEEGRARRTRVGVLVMRVVGKGLTRCQIDALPEANRPCFAVFETQHEHMRMLRRSTLRQPDPHDCETTYDRQRCQECHQPLHVRSLCAACVVQHYPGEPGSPAARGYVANPPPTS